MALRPARAPSTASLFSPWEAIRRLFGGPAVIEAENPNTLFCIPVYVRRDGLVVRVGGSAQIADKPESYVIKDILISYDLEQVTFTHYY